MQHGMVDLAIVGTDRVTANGDVCNKIGTYLKALAAHDNGVPFYVALPSPTIDFSIDDGIKQIRSSNARPAKLRTSAGVRLTGESRPCGWFRRVRLSQLRFRRYAGAVGDRIDHRTRACSGPSVLHLRARFPSGLALKAALTSHANTVSSMPTQPARSIPSMSNTEIEIVVDDPTAPESRFARSHQQRRRRRRCVAVAAGACGHARMGQLAHRRRLGFDRTAARLFSFYLSVILGAASLYGIGAAFLSRKEAAETFVTRAQLRRVMAVSCRRSCSVSPRNSSGFYVASFALIAGFMRLVGKIALWKSLLTAFVFTAAMFVTFDIAFDVIMRRGRSKRPLAISSFGGQVVALLSQ